MQYIKDIKSFKKLSDILIGRTVRFVSDCRLFTNFDHTTYVESIDIANNGEFLFQTSKISKGKKKRLTIGSNMSNLQFEIIN